MKKKTMLIALFVAVFMLFSLTACNNQESPSDDLDPSQGQDQGDDENQLEAPIKVALLLSGPITDQGWNASAYQGLVAIEEELGAEISYTERVSQSDVEEVLRNYAMQDFDVIFGHGFEFFDGIMSLHADFPDNIFLLTSNTVFEEPNVGSVTDDGLVKGFLGGVVAAAISEDDQVAFLGGAETPPILAGLNGFIAGAQYVNPEVDVRTALTGNFEDAGQANETAVAMIDNGIDVLMVQVDMAGLGAIEAAEDAGIYVIGTNTDQNALAPDTIVTSAMADYSVAMPLVVNKIMQGQWEPSSTVLGIKEGMVDLAPYYNFEDKLSEEAKNTIEEVKQEIIDGTIDPAALVEALDQ